MSTVLTKPVLLDETGQAIVGKLQDIQQAIGGTGEFIPINIRVTTPPTKTNYLAGETLDLSGMVVTLVANNGGMYDVTGDCVFSPANGSTVTTSTTEVNISYTWYKDSTVFTAVQVISVKELLSIAVTTPPLITEYSADDTLDLDGMVVTATFSDGTTDDVTTDCVFDPADGDVLSISDTAINISYTLGAVTKTAVQAITVIGHLFGAEWDGTATTAWTRTDGAENFVDPNPYYAGMESTPSSPFDNIMPWKGMTIVEDSAAGSLVSIPKYWFKWTRDGVKMKLQISNIPADGFHVSPAHADRGDGKGERDVVYVGRYHTVFSVTSGSRPGYIPKGSETRASFRTQTHALGTTIWQYDFAMYWTIMMLYLVEFADWNSQDKIGYGCTNIPGSSYSARMTMGYTDSMPYHTGTTESSRLAYGGTQYRHIEGLWDNVLDFCDGIYFSGDNIYAIKNPANYSDTSGGTYIGQRSNTRAGYISAWTDPSAIAGFEYALFPSALNGSDTTYICDGSGRGNSPGIVLITGGSYVQSKESGAFSIAGSLSASASDSSYGSRLQKLP